MPTKEVVIWRISDSSFRSRQRPGQNSHGKRSPESQDALKKPKFDKYSNKLNRL